MKIVIAIIGSLFISFWLAIFEQMLLSRIPSLSQGLSGSFVSLNSAGNFILTFIFLGQTILIAFLIYKWMKKSS